MRPYACGACALPFVRSPACPRVRACIRTFAHALVGASVRTSALPPGRLLARSSLARPFIRVSIRLSQRRIICSPSGRPSALKATCPSVCATVLINPSVLALVPLSAHTPERACALPPSHSKVRSFVRPRHCFRACVRLGVRSPAPRLFVGSPARSFVRLFIRSSIRPHSGVPVRSFVSAPTRPLG